MISSTYKVLWGYKNLFNFEDFLNISANRPFSPLFFVLQTKIKILLVRKKIFFSELRKKIGYVFDVKISNLSIYDVFRARGAPQIRFPASASFFPPN